MTLRMHRVPQSRWTQLAASRRSIDLVEEEAADARREKSRRGHDEHAEIQAAVDAAADRRASIDS